MKIGDSWRSLASLPILLGEFQAIERPGLKRKVDKAWEMAQLVKCFLNKHKNLSSYPRTYVNSQAQRSVPVIQ